MLKLTVVAPRGADVPELTRLYNLTPDQVRRRAHKLAPVTEGEKARPLTVVAVARAGVMFKKGETIHVDEAAAEQLAAAAFADAEGNTLGERRVLARDAARAKLVAEQEANDKKSPPPPKAKVTDRAVR